MRKISEEANRHSQLWSSWNANWIVFAAAAGIAVLWIVLWWWDRRMSRGAAGRSREPSESLFERLCNEHRLTAEDRRRLHEIQREQGLDNPVLLFVDERPLKQRETEELRRKLFGRAA